MVDHRVLHVNSETIQWAGPLLDRFIAPKFSSLTTCEAPELPEPTNYSGSFVINNIFIGEAPPPWRPLVIVFLRRLASAVRAYRNGQEAMLQCVSSRACSNDMIRKYLRALSEFEISIINAYLCQMAHDSLCKKIDSTSPRSFQKDDGSPLQRLNLLYNALKHFDDNIIEEHVVDHVLPIWLVNDGIEGAGKKGVSKLGFLEMIAILNDLEEEARFISEELYRQAHKSRAAKSAGLSPEEVSD